MGNSTSLFSPTILYGVQELSDYKLLSKQFLKEFGMCRLPTLINVDTGHNYVYGIYLTLDDIKENKFDDKKEKVDIFIKIMKEKYGFEMGSPEIHLCLDGKSKLDSHVIYYGFDEEDVEESLSELNAFSNDDDSDNESCKSNDGSNESNDLDLDIINKMEETKIQPDSPESSYIPSFW